ncbi:hypothetical protein [Bartonella sp. B39]
MKALDKTHYDTLNGERFMNLRYFIAAFAIFTSVSVAQGGTSMVAPKLEQGIASAISFKSSRFNEQVSGALSEVFQKKFSCIGNSKCEAAIEFVAASRTVKKRKVRKPSKKKKVHIEVFNVPPLFF